MRACLGEIHGKPVILEVKDGGVWLNGQLEPIKNISEKDVRKFNAEIEALPKSDDPGYEALVNAVRAAFIAKLLGGAVGDDCIERLTHILDHVHYDVLKYLGETGEE